MEGWRGGPGYTSGKNRGGSSNLDPCGGKWLDHPVGEEPKKGGDEGVGAQEADGEAGRSKSSGRAACG